MLWYECLCGDGVFPFYFVTLETTPAERKKSVLKVLKKKKTRDKLRKASHLFLMHI
jgi:hypothetical protein